MWCKGGCIGCFLRRQLILRVPYFFLVPNVIVVEALVVGFITVLLRWRLRWLGVMLWWVGVGLGGGGVGGVGVVVRAVVGGWFNWGRHSHALQ